MDKAKHKRLSEIASLLGADERTRIEGRDLKGLLDDSVALGAKSEQVTTLREALLEISRLTNEPTNAADLLRRIDRAARRVLDKDSDDQ